MAGLAAWPIPGKDRPWYRRRCAAWPPPSLPWLHLLHQPTDGQLCGCCWRTLNWLDRKHGAGHNKIRGWAKAAGGASKPGWRLRPIRCADHAASLMLMSTGRFRPCSPFSAHGTKFCNTELCSWLICIGTSWLPQAATAPRPPCTTSQTASLPLRTCRRPH